MLELNQLYNMDCMEGMKTFPDKYFDLAIVDPPYGIGESGQTNKTRSCIAKSKDYGNKQWDETPPSINYFQELIRVSKNQIIWGGNHFISDLKSTTSFIVWDKDNGENDFADCELAWTNHKTSVRKFRYKWHGMLQENMKNKELRIHPTQKPIQLYKWILHNYAKPDFKILDTHAGSCSSVIAFLDYGCDWIAFEIDKDYYEAASKRIENHKLQLKLF